MSESTKNDAIYLQVCDDEDSEWLGYVTWCQDRIHESDVKYIRADLVESMRQQLAAAIVACKVKDEAIASQMKVTSWEEQAQANDLSEDALAIQPDDSALKAWLGEPVAYIDDAGCCWMAKLGRQNGTPLFAPKGKK